MDRPCPNCGAPMSESHILNFTTRRKPWLKPTDVQCTAIEWQLLKEESQRGSDGVMPPKLLEKYGLIRWHCSPCLLTIESEHKAVAPPD